ncbi:MAG: DNA topoisomerase III [Defluviitaleaceae bacterium]|nr:DNA topoisomerase III [Defluviitaleaceae bacterium]
MKCLVIAEKPSVARDIARVLKCTQRGDGCLHGSDYVVSWAIGHLVTLQEPEDYNPALKRWQKSDLPIVPANMGLKPIQRTESQLNILKKLMDSNEITQIICATDSGREGELIFRYIYHWAKCTKPVKRLWISSLTDAAITDGLSKMRDGCEYDNLYASARCRAEADWLVGMNATRAFTLKNGELLPVGRVQTPTLAILVDRQKEIAAFVSKEYWEVHATFIVDENIEAQYPGIWVSPEGEQKIQEKEQAEAIATKVNNATGIVESVETEEKRQLPPQLFDLTELQRECNRKLHFSAQKTLSVAQSLYEKHKLITYPRTDSRYLSKDIEPKLRPVLESIKDAPYNSFAAHILSLPKLPTTSRVINDKKVTDHHAIIPTGSKKSLSGLTSDERAVYDRILRNFLAVFYPAYVYDITTVITLVVDERFQSKGRMDKNLGWTALYAHEKQATKDDDSPALPQLSKDTPIITTEAKVQQKKTQPPKPYTEASLLSAMEHAGRFVDDEALKEALKASGLGTPATRAAIIEKLISSGYVERNKKNLVPTSKAMGLIDMSPPELRSPETTGKWERGLQRIANGELDDKRFMESIKRYVLYLIQWAG